MVRWAAPSASWDASAAEILLFGVDMDVIERILIGALGDDIRDLIALSRFALARLRTR
ncbi:hypothetical protein [Mycobacterium avium]|uniref:hypothetical protein n=1 Tax=Mycobacterium avium TaxID=1764 RepID=UPI001595ABAC|nr:hypothetical protein [Mycobacterium avium]